MTAPHELARTDQVRASARADALLIADAVRAHIADCPDGRCYPEAVVIAATEGSTVQQLTIWLAAAALLLAELLPDTGPAAPDGIDPWAPYNYPPCARCDPRPCDCHEPGNLTGGDHAAP